MATEKNKPRYLEGVAS